MAAATITTSVVPGGVNNHATSSTEANSIATDFVNQGVVGTVTNTNGASPSSGSFAVNQDTSPDMGVTVSAGAAYITGTPSTLASQSLRAYMASNYTAYTINANASGSTKFDWLYLSLNVTNATNPSSAADNVITLFTSRSTSNVSDNGTPPTYGILLAVITVANGASSITNANIADKRTQTSLNTGLNLASTTGWQTLNSALTYSANNGNKEYQVTATGDLTGTLSKGMKMSIARSVTPPSQSMAFVAASSQYATKTSPSGITFTGPFTCEAWIYLNSYTSQQQFIVNRFDRALTSGGWAYNINGVGAIEIDYGTTTNFTSFVSYQAVPLKKWIHIAAVVTSVSSKTGQIYINGTAVPTQTVNSASTTLTQPSQDLRLGAASATPANTYFDGYISEARVWSTNQTQANIQANMTKNLVGNETNLVALFQGNGNFNDATANANNLTANGGAIATNTANPYNATEYAIISNISYSNPTTTITLFTGTDSNIPNQTLNTPQYSTVRSPYGFPSGIGRWRMEYLMSSITITTPAGGSWNNFVGSDITANTGDGIIGYQVTFASSRVSAGNLDGIFTISTTTSSETDQRLSTGILSQSAQVTSGAPMKIEVPISSASQTTYHALMSYDGATGARNNAFLLSNSTQGRSLFYWQTAYI